MRPLRLIYPKSPCKFSELWPKTKSWGSPQWTLQKRVKDDHDDPKWVSIKTPTLREQWPRIRSFFSLVLNPSERLTSRAVAMEGFCNMSKAQAPHRFHSQGSWVPNCLLNPSPRLSRCLFAWVTKCGRVSTFNSHQTVSKPVDVPSHPSLPIAKKNHTHPTMIPHWTWKALNTWRSRDPEITSEEQHLS